MKPFIYVLIAVIAYILFKRDPLLVLFIVGAYLLYRYLAGNKNEGERGYFNAMSQMAITVSRTMGLIVANLDQLNAAIERIDKPSPEAFITPADETDEFEHLA